MNLPVHLLSRVWAVIPIGALGFLVWINHARIQRVEFVSGLPGRAESVEVPDPASPTGHGLGQRELIVPERSENSFHWIAQTQQMFAQREWRVRRADYDNAPFGREVSSASPFRWWLGLVAWVDHELSGRPIGLSVERAALWAEPVLHGLLLLGLTMFVAWRFGVLAGALFAVGVVTIFPFAAGFLPGVPDDHGLANGCALGSILALLAGMNALRAGVAPGGTGLAGQKNVQLGMVGAVPGIRVDVPFGGAAGKNPELTTQNAKRQNAKSQTASSLVVAQASQPASSTAGGCVGGKARCWFVLAGVIGGIGVWISVSTQVPILAGVLVGALAAAWIVRRRAAEDPAGVPMVPPWRLWACSGGATVLGCYLIEFFPAHLGSWRLNAVHPLYGLAWMGAGELLTRAVAWIQRNENPFRRTRNLIVVALAVAAVAALPVVMKLGQTRGFLAADLSSFRLTAQPNGVVASSLWAWLVRDGLSARLWATVLPVVLVFPAGWLILRRKTDVTVRASLALAVGPVAVALAFACYRLNWWHVLDGALLALAALAMPAQLAVGRRWGRWLVFLLAVLLVIPGVVQLWPQQVTKAEDELTSSEAEGLIERDLAHWLAKHAGGEGAVVYAPPYETASLAFYGGLAGVGTLNVDNDDGMRATIMIASATTLPEAQILMQARQIRYIVIPSWDPFFDDYARLYLVQSQANRKSILIPELRRLNLPPWLRPLPCQILKIGGYEGQSVLVFEVVDEQSPAVAMSRLAEYLVETGDLAKAASADEGLRRFPGDVGALAARAQVQSARADDASLTQTLKALLSRLSNGGDRFLPWDRRVSLATVLARAGRIDQSREQVRHCLADLSEKRLRSLSTGSLYNLLVLSHSFGLVAADPKLRALSLELLPVDLRSSL